MQRSPYAEQITAVRVGGVYVYHLQPEAAKVDVTQCMALNVQVNDDTREASQVPRTTQQAPSGLLT